MKLFPIHRLDEEVSGLLMYALTPDSHRSANRWFEKHEIQKTYFALSSNASKEKSSLYSAETLWECKLLRGKKRAYEADFGKPAKTLATFLGHNDESNSVWKLLPLTGRSHQLRYEMTRHGFPILGDSLYGSQSSYQNPDGIALRAMQLDFANCQDRGNFQLPSELKLDLGKEFKVTQ